ncbi:Ig-like domain-containing protein [Paenibacillus sp. S150]|uniref:Ig-like domain-containing protein n=1 Tax=Paenibacillus sp. S150 TaxID=2749826 RepID=UPI0035CAC224
MNYTSVKDAPVRFTSSDEGISAVNSTGLVTSISEGVTAITVYNATNKRISDTITINVITPMAYSIKINTVIAWIRIQMRPLY